ncbi:MAG TPA: M14 family zinc carboxypeptidase [bacterium]|nr:M14 family zinc carboxypeptidase [bacterium]
MEARVYFDDVRTLRQLGDLAGELDVCTWVKDTLGGYLVIDTDSSQLKQIRAAGLLADVTYPDIRQKFREMTGLRQRQDLEPANRQERRGQHTAYSIQHTGQTDVQSGEPASGRGFGYYLTYYQVEDSLAALASTYPSICKLTSAGLSYENRNIWVLKVSSDVDSTENKPAFYVEGAIHAREPMATSACVAFAERLLTQYGRDSMTTWLVNNREVYIIPVVNADGYVYNSDSGGDEANWRKNRRSPVPPDIGVDLNRNFGYKWGADNEGSTGHPWDETYRGPAPFSEPETQVIRDFLLAHRPRTCMDLHSFGRYNMYPWGCTVNPPPDRAMLAEMVDTFQANNHYPLSQTGQICTTIYPCNGMSTDWEYSDTAGKFSSYAFNCELGIYDFWYGWLDSSYIRNECNLNIPNLYYLTRVAGAWFDVASSVLDDSVTGNGNGRIDPNELSGIWFTLRNRAVHPMDSAYAITARLVSESPDVQVLDSGLSFPNVLRSSTVDDHATQFHIRTSGTIARGTFVPLRLELSFTDAGRMYNQGVEFSAPNWRRPVTAFAPPACSLRLTAAPIPAVDRVRFSPKPAAAVGRLDIFAIDGTRMAMSAVSGPYVWDCTRVPAGIYFCRLTAAGNTATTRVSIVH